jgi:hypothetical protein
MKLYVLVRDDLKTPGYKAVQAGHAVAEFLLEYGKTPGWDNGTLVFLVVKSEDELEYYQDLFAYREKLYSSFYEPDIGNQLTAVAVLGADTLVKDLPLL